jgi:hypothetical protein
MGIWSEATDNFDDGIDWLINPTDGGAAGVYHQQEPGSWDGPEGFYYKDIRGPLEPDGAKIWDTLYVWAHTDFLDPTMYFSLQGDITYPPSDELAYYLELLEVPAEVTGAPPVGTVWDIPWTGLFSLELPTFRTTDGLEGYRFSFTIDASVPEPSSVLLLGVGAVALLPWPRRRM